MTQTAIPDATTSAGSWVNHGAARLHNCIDEGIDSANDDTDYISEAGSNSTAKFTTSNTTDPGVDYGHTLRLRHKLIVSGNFAMLQHTLRLKQGSTTIATRSSSTPTTSYVSEDFLLTDGEVAAITDYTDLNLELVCGVAVYGSPPGSGEARVTAYQLDLPSVGAIKGSNQASGGPAGSATARGAATGAASGGAAPALAASGRGALTASANAGAGPSGALAARGALSATLGGASSAVVPGRMVIRGTGAEAAGASPAGAAFGRAGMAASQAAAASHQGGASARGAIAAVAQAGASPQGQASGRGALAGSVASAAAVAAAGQLIARLTGSAAGGANPRGTGRLVSRITGTAKAGSRDARAFISARGQLAGSSAGGASSSGAVSATAYIAALARAGSAGSGVMDAARVSVVGCIEALLNAVRLRFETLVEVPQGIPAVYDDEPPENLGGAEAWVRFTAEVRPVDQLEFAIPPNATRLRGRADAQIYLKLGVGDAAAWSLADAINDAFRAVTDAGVIYAPPPYATLRARSGEFWQLDVTIPFYSECVEPVA